MQDGMGRFQHTRCSDRPLCAAMAGVAAPAADAAWTIKGRGFGHGVGMSQYGAYGFAQHGLGYKRILSHYYTPHEADADEDREASGC